MKDSSQRCVSREGALAENANWAARESLRHTFRTLNITVRLKTWVLQLSKKAASQQRIVSPASMCNTDIPWCMLGLILVVRQC